MRLRTQLLFVSLLTLALPWAGCQYAREFESALRQSQQNALADSAGAIASVIAERPAMLVRDPVQLVSGADNSEDDIYAYRLPSFVTLDGFDGDWDLGPDKHRPLQGSVDARFATGIEGNRLWLFVEVADDELVYERPGLDSFDHLRIDYEDPNGTPQQLLVATSAVGRIGVRRRVNGNWVPEPAAQAVWEQNATGYQLEIRFRDRLVGARLGLTVVDVDRDDQSRSASYRGTRPGFLLHRLEPLERSLADFRFTGRRLLVVDARGRVVALVGDTRTGPPRRQAPPALAERLIRRIVSPSLASPLLRESHRDRLESAEVRAALDGHAQARWYSTATDPTAIVVAAHPVRTEAGVIGAVILEQTSEAILTLTDRALTRLLTLTLAATLLAAAALVGFATYLSLRIRRLSQAAEQAVGPEGTIGNTSLPGQAAGDEIGDLSRSFAGLLSRLREHTDYLRTLAGKLSHELRTPLTVVQSSLDNLDATGLPDEARVYAVRAREGASRLRSILTAMSEASRVEQAIGQAEPERFDLAELVRGCLNGYRDIHGSHRFGLRLPDAPCPIDGVPELIAQMLDKLIDNAVDFSPGQSRIEVGLDPEPSGYRLSVANEGPPLPDRMQDQLFDSMVSLRSKKGTTPHLGFGLHIARLIAESHGATIAAGNLPNGHGVEFSVVFPAGLPAGP